MRARSVGSRGKQLAAQCSSSFAGFFPKPTVHGTEFFFYLASVDLKRDTCAVMISLASKNDQKVTAAFLVAVVPHETV